jgi:hypothetical protein
VSTNMSNDGVMVADLNGAAVAQTVENLASMRADADLVIADLADPQSVEEYGRWHSLTVRPPHIRVQQRSPYL